MSRMVFRGGPTIDVISTAGDHLPAEINGRWAVITLEQAADEIDIGAFGGASAMFRTGPSHLRMEAEMVDPIPAEKLLEDLEERNRAFALRDEPEDVRDAIKALFEIQRELPPGMEAIVEVEPGPRFTVRVRECGG